MKTRAFNYRNVSKKEKVIFGIILAILVVAYNFIWLNRSFTMSEGWVATYVGLINQGKVPYRDFYYFLPPLNLLIDYVIWTISSGYFFIYRIIRLAERVLIAELMYILVSKKVDSFIASVGTFLGVVLAAASGYDLVGDYNQTIQLLVVLLCIVVYKYVENIDNLKVKWKWMFLAGVVGGCMFLSKQTIIVSSGLTFALFILYLVVTKKENNFIKMVITVVAGLAVPLGICFAYMVFTRSLTEFFYQVFIDTSSKGTLIDIVLLSQTGMIGSFIRSFIAIVFVGAVFWLQNKKSTVEIKSKTFTAAQLALSFVAAALIGSAYFDNAFMAIKDSAKTGLPFLFAVFIIVILIVDLNKVYGKIAVLLAGVINVLVLLFNVYDCAKVLYKDTETFNLMNSLVTVVHLALAVYVTLYVIYCQKEKKKVDYFTVVMICGALASGWATSMSSGVNALTVSTAFVSIPVLTLVIFKDKRINKQIFVKLFFVFALACICICGAQKSQNAYSWWGDSEHPFTEKNYTSEIKALKGFKFSYQERAKYDELTKIIDYYTDENSVIFGFPYAKVYNVFLENYNMDNFVPVVFYDVCADDYAKKDAKVLANNPPDIVVWQDIPNCMESHEKYFRDGEPLGQRKIQAWFNSVYEKDYELVGQVDCVYIYKLKNNQKVDKTYIERKSRENKTVGLKRSTPKNTLKGEGTEEEPYLISSEEDFNLFRKLVNNGVNFEDEYVKQTADVDLSKLETWSTIGKYNSDYTFYGTYDGAGYRIKNLKLDNEETKGYYGLFGELEGTAMNIILESPTIKGSYVGGIASHAGEDSVIINCAVIGGTIEGQYRAGGICDNSIGDVINCVSTANVKSKDIACAVTSYYYGDVLNCYSNEGQYGSLDDGDKIDKNTATKLNDYAKDLTEYDNLLAWEATSNGLVLVKK